MNAVKQLGRLTKDPKMVTTQNQTALCILELAVEHRFKSANGTRGADFFTCKAYGVLATFAANNLHKGERILISGRLMNESWKDKFEQNRISTVIVVSEIYFADGKKPSVKADTADYPEVSFDEDLPLFEGDK